MHRRRILTTLFVLLAALVSLGVVATSANASPAATFSAPREGVKVIPGDTSIDGPAIMAMYRPQTALAWTGTDGAHHLNVATVVVSG